MQVFLDNFAVYSRQIEHLDHLRLCLEKCSEYRLSLNPAKCVFGVASGNLLGHIVSKDGITVHLDKGREILKAPTPNNAKALSRFLGQIRWHNRMIRHLADFAIPLHAVVHRVPFQWAEQNGNNIPSTKGNSVTSPGSSTSRLDEEFPCVRRCVRYCNWKRPNAADQAKMVPTNILR